MAYLNTRERGNGNEDIVSVLVSKTVSKIGENLVNIMIQQRPDGDD